MLTAVCARDWRRIITTRLDGRRGEDRPPLRTRQVEAAVVEELTTTVISHSDPASSSAGCGPDDECPICLGLFSDGDSVKRLPCGHAYHCQCVDRWLDRCIEQELLPTCPMCKAVPFGHRQVVPKLVTQVPDVLPVRRREGLAAFAAPLVPDLWRGMHAEEDAVRLRTVHLVF